MAERFTVHDALDVSSRSRSGTLEQRGRSVAVSRRAPPARPHLPPPTRLALGEGCWEGYSAGPNRWLSLLSRHRSLRRRRRAGSTRLSSVLLSSMDQVKYIV
jgi:hypothetical protein